MIRSPLLFKNPTITKYDEILRYGPLISLIICIDLYLYAKYPSSLTSKLLTTSILIDMGNNSYAFYCLVEALPRLLLLVSGVVEKSAIMMLWAGIGIAAFAHYYIEMPIYNWANKKLPKCQCT
jgi:peptidoglycan/LPS O-acetylase OafA/YrhL